MKLDEITKEMSVREKERGEMGLSPGSSNPEICREEESARETEGTSETGGRQEWMPGRQVNRGCGGERSTIKCC